MGVLRGAEGQESVSGSDWIGRRGHLALGRSSLQIRTVCLPASLPAAHRCPQRHVREHAPDAGRRSVGRVAWTPQSVGTGCFPPAVMSERRAENTADRRQGSRAKNGGDGKIRSARRNGKNRLISPLWLVARPPDQQRNSLHSFGQDHRDCHLMQPVALGSPATQGLDGD